MELHKKDFQTFLTSSNGYLHGAYPQRELSPR